MRHFSMVFLILAICCFAFQSGADEGEIMYSWQVELGLRTVDQNGDETKFEEYRDMGDGLCGSARVQADKENLYYKLDADRIGREDQQYEFMGGKYGKFKIQMFYDEIPHAYARDAKSYFNGVGSAALVDSGNHADPTPWQGFDYDKQQKNAGFKGEYNFDTPYYLEFGANRKDSEGIYPLGGPAGTELPAPVDWNEQNWFFGGGYQSRTIVASLRADISYFDNKNEWMTWDSQTTSLAPDSEFYKYSGKFIYRNPFLSSQYSVRASHSRKENSFDLTRFYSSTLGTFRGEVVNTRVDASWDFVPISYMDMKLFAGYADTDDESDMLTVSTVATVPYDHEKRRAGFDTTLRLPSANFLDIGYRYVDACRSYRTDNDETLDNLTFFQYRNRSFDRFSFKARYEYLNREGDYNGTEVGTRRYDVANQVKNELAMEAEYFFTDQLFGAIEYAWWNRDYGDTIYGLNGTEHHEAYVSSGFSVSDSLSATVYIGYEYDENEMATNQNWSQAEEFDTIAYGAALEFPVMDDRLEFILSWDHSKVDGSADFKPSTNNYLNLMYVDDCTIQRLEAKSIYNLNSDWDITMGYLFEKFDLHDGQYDGYAYLPPGATLTGAYAEQDYDAHVVYLSAVFRF